MKRHPLLVSAAVGAILVPWLMTLIFEYVTGGSPWGISILMFLITPAFVFMLIQIERARERPLHPAMIRAMTEHLERLQRQPTQGPGHGTLPQQPPQGDASGQDLPRDGPAARPLGRVERMWEEWMKRHPWLVWLAAGASLSPLVPFLWAAWVKGEWHWSGLFYTYLVMPGVFALFLGDIGRALERLQRRPIQDPGHSPLPQQPPRGDVRKAMWLGLFLGIMIACLCNMFLAWLGVLARASEPPASVAAGAWLALIIVLVCALLGVIIGVGNSTSR
jgi:hypothetical protein